MVILTFMLVSIMVVIAAANPIPIDGDVYMMGEKIDTTISYAGESMSIPKAFVTGTYNMVVLASPPENATMYYPVHPNSTNISIEIDGTPLDWTWNNTYYRITVNGWFNIDFPIIKFTISPVPPSFTITANYEHIVPTHDSYLTFLYAYGSARVFQNPKDCDANITTYISKDIAGSTEDIEAYLLTSVGEMEPAAYTITSIGSTWKVNYFEAFTLGFRDYLITIGMHPIPQPVGGISIPVDKLELLAPYIGLTILLAVAVVTVVYVKSWRKH